MIDYNLNIPLLLSNLCIDFLCSNIVNIAFPLIITTSIDLDEWFTPKIHSSLEIFLPYSTQMLILSSQLVICLVAMTI